MQKLQSPHRRFILGGLGAALLLGFASASLAADEEAQQGATPEPAFAAGEMALGAEHAPVTIIEYFSLTCGYCANFHRNAFEELKAAYIDTAKVRFIAREFPSSELALKAAMLARCSGEERYFAFIQELYKQFDYWTEADDPLAALAQIAALGGLPRERFDACLVNEALEERVLQSYMECVREHEVEYTPTFIINGKAHVGDMPFEKFREILEPLLSGA